MPKDVIAEISEQTRPIFQKYGIKHASVFGSFARGEAREDSDIDVLFAVDPGTFSLFDLAGMRSDLSETLGRDVDLVSERAVVPRFRDFIYRDLRVIYER